MAADFCLRLACGLICALLFLPSGQVNPRFYRVHFLTALAIGVVGVVFAYQSDIYHTRAFWTVVLASLPLCFVGSLLWSLDGAPLGRLMIVATALGLLASLELNNVDNEASAVAMADAYASAILMGCAMTAMLLGHSYLIAPSMPIRPLLRILAGLFLALVAQSAISGTTLWFWTREHSLATLNEATMLVAMRWGLGLALPIVLTVMAWQTAKIRSTQSATGILYVVVIFCFIGELMSMLLARISEGLLL